MLLQLSFFWRAVAGYVVHCRGHCKVPLLAEHGKHAQVVHHARARLQGTIISFITHHFRSSIILDSESILYPLYHFIYYKNPMYTTFSVVESIPPLTSRRRRPVLFSLPPVVVVSSSPPVFKISQAPLARSTPVHVYARPVQLTRSYLRSRSVHGSRRAPQFTTHAFNPPSLPFHGFRSVPISDDR